MREPPSTLIGQKRRRSPDSHPSQSELPLMSQSSSDEQEQEELESLRRAAVVVVMYAAYASALVVASHFNSANWSISVPTNSEQRAPTICRDAGWNRETSSACVEEVAEQDGFELSSVSTATSKFKKKRTKKKRNGNGIVVEGLKLVGEGMDLIAAALEKLSRSNLELEERVAQETQKLDGMSMKSQLKVCSALTENHKAAQAFLAVTGEYRRMWLELEFGADIFDA